MKVGCSGILQRGSKVLIVKRQPTATYLPGKWELPGGKPEGMEKIGDCVEREFMEETGIKVQIPNLPWNTTVVGDGATVYFFEVVEVNRDKEVGFPTREHEAAAWISLDEINDFDLSNASKEALLTYKKDKL